MHTHDADSDQRDAAADVSSDRGMTQSEIILAAITNNPGQTSTVYAKLTNLNRDQVSKRMSDLRQKGEIKVVGKIRSEYEWAPTTEKEREEPERKQPVEGERRGVGIRYATEAINCLKRIPRSDGLREDGYDMVASYIKQNR